MRSTWRRTAAVLTSGALLGAGLALAPAPAQAAAGDAVIDSADCLQNELPANDDNSTTKVDLPFGVNFYGESFSSVYVNNNGNVTFDAPLSTFTPFGLATTERKIIAPFFGDVDTRTGNTVRYGWGNTTYEGQRAFCVNWVDVGYYAYGTDKTNSFQLLLVQRADGDPGDFDIVFNYDRVQWESGSASGGSGGLGGTSASAGFSNGSGRPGTSYQLAGSLVNGAFLDTSPTGLAVTSTDSAVTGRHVFRVRGGGAPLTTYVALGDSFQSGEGAGGYLPLTDTSDNKCHRSVYAYPQRLVDDGVVDLNIDFGACSGAVIDDLDVTYDPSRPPYTDGQSQLGRLNSSTKLVTLGIGGNDMEFSDILKGCIGSTVVDYFRFWADTSCEEKYDQQLQDNFTALVDGGRLRDIYQVVRERAPFARIVVVTYPRFYEEGGSGNQYLDDYCAGVRRTDQRWINAGIRRLDDAIADAAGSLGLQVVDIYDTPTGHELCGPSSEHFMNGVKPTALVESYHPNAFGHGLIADDVTAALRSLPPGDLFNVMPGQTIDHQFPVGPTDELNASTQWPGSDVVLTLVSPSGRTYSREAPGEGVEHLVGPTFETYRVPDPEQGTWTARLFGKQVAPEGEETRLVVHTPDLPNALPVAALTQTLSGRTVTVDAGSSTDADGEIVEYLWDFGDGTTATGRTATHTYAQDGTYKATLAIKDDRGGEDFAAASTTVTVVAPVYDFGGFERPVEAAPTVNAMRAGRAVPLVFSLGGDHGLDVLEPGSPGSTRISCDTQAAESEVEQTSTAGSSSLSYDAATGRYTYVWKTESSWAGTCRRMTLVLADGTAHSAVFRFRG